MADDYTIFVTNGFDDATFVLTSGEGSNAAKEVKPKYFRENLQALMRAYYLFRHAPGADLTINAGASNDNQLSIDVDPTGLIQAGHQVLVYNADGSKVWLDTAATDGNVIITNAKLIKGSDVSDYDTDITDISSYTVLVVGKENCLLTVGRASISTGAAPGAFNADDLPMTNTDTEKVQAVVDALEDTLDTLTDYNKTTRTAGTALASDVVTAASVGSETFADEGFKNFIRNGSFERWPQGPSTAPNSEGWEEESATVAQETTNTLYGDSAMKIRATAAARGVKYTVSNHSDYAGRTITVSAMVKESDPGDVLIQIDDGPGTTDGTAVTLSGSWQEVSCTHTLDASATELTILFLSSGGAASWYMDGVTGVLGSVVKSYDASTHDDIAEDDVIPVNWLLNPGFESWDIYGTATCDTGYDRDYWVKYGLGNLKLYTGTAMQGAYSLCTGEAEATGANTGIKQEIGKLGPVQLALAGKTVCFSAWFKPDGADGDWRIEIYDGTTTTYTEFSADDLTEYTQISVVADLASGMGEGFVVRIYAVDGEDADDKMYIDGACLNVGSRPAHGAGFGIPSAWSRVTHTFQYSGELSGDAYVGLWQPVSRTFYPAKIEVYCGTGAGSMGGTGTAEYILHSGTHGAGESADNLSCTLTAEASPDADGQAGSSVNTLAHARDDAQYTSRYIRVYQDLTTTSTNPEDITVVVTGWSAAH